MANLVCKNPPDKNNKEFDKTEFNAQAFTIEKNTYTTIRSLLIYGN